MSKRLQVVMEDDELDEIRAAASRQRMTVAEWVRQSLREARKSEPTRTVEAKLDSIREAQRNKHPTADIDQMLEEIARGALAGSGSDTE